MFSVRNLASRPRLPAALLTALAAVFALTALVIGARRRTALNPLSAASAAGHSDIPHTAAYSRTIPVSGDTDEATARRSIVRLTALLACALLVAAAVVFQLIGRYNDDSAETRILVGTLLAVLGALCLHLALRFSSYSSLIPHHSVLSPQSSVLKWRILIPQTAAGLLALALLAAVNDVRLNHPYLRMFTVHAQFALLVAGILLTAWGMSGVAHPRLPRIPRREALLVLAITAVAFVLRAYRVEDALRWFIDEFLFVDTAVLLQRDPFTRLLIPFQGYSSIVWVYPYLQSWTIALFGHNLTGLRAISVVIGTATIPALYLLGRNLFNHRVGMIAALLLATFAPHLHFSRVALYNIGDPLFGVLALAFLVRALRHNRQSDFALSGALLGVSHYFYEGGRVLYTALVVLWLVSLGIFALAGGLPGFWRRWRGLALALLAFLLVVAPLYSAWSSTTVLTRLQQTGGLHLSNLTQPDGLAQFWINNLRKPILHFIQIPDGSLWHYGGEAPLMLVYVVPLFFIGLAYLLRRPRSLATPLLVWWLALTVAGNSILDFQDFTARFVVVFPALPLIAALGFTVLFDLLLPQHSSLSTQHSALSTRRLIPARRGRLAAAALLVLIAAGQAVYYFGPHLTTLNHQLRANYRDYLDIFFRALDLPPDTRIHVITDDDVHLPHYNLLRLFYGLEDEIEVLDPSEVTNEWLLLTYGESAAHAFFIVPEDNGTYQRLSSWFYMMPGEYSPYNVPREAQYLLYFAPNTGLPPPFTRGETP